VGRSGTGILKVDGQPVATQVMERTLPFTVAWDENFDVGADTITPVDDQDYQVPFRFNGKLDKLTLTINRPQLTPADEKKLMEAQRNNRVSE
jgi:arylsulfatase